MKLRYVEERFGAPVIHGEFPDSTVSVDDPHGEPWFARISRAEAERFVARWEKLVEFAARAGVVQG